MHCNVIHIWCNVSDIYCMHQFFPNFSSPRGWPWSRSNFWQWIFWKLSASPSESTRFKLGLDKRKFKSAGWILRNLQFSEIFVLIVPGHDFHRFARPPRVILLNRLFWAVFYSRLYTPYCSNQPNRPTNTRQFATDERGDAEILNIARSAGPQWILRS